MIKSEISGQKNQSAFYKYVINNPKGFFSVREKKEYWKELTNDISGEFKLITTVSRDLDKLQIKCIYNGIQITFSETDTKPLLIQATIQSELLKDFYFEITKGDFIERLLSKLSKKVITLNNSKFDKDYIIKTNNKEKTFRFLDSKSIVDYLLDSDIFYIEGKAQNNNTDFTLMFNVNREVNSYEYLKFIQELFFSFIDNLNKL